MARTGKKKITAIIIAALAAVLISMFGIACNHPETDPTDNSAKPEHGVYMSGGYAVSLNAEYKASFTTPEVTASGTYVLEGNAVVLKLESMGDINGTYDGNSITITYNGNTLRLLKNVSYEVKFIDGNNTVSILQIRNGESISNDQKPADPTKAGQTFIGWYKDSGYTTPFYFDVDAITKDTKLYARWTANTEGNVYTVKFDLNYENAPNVKSIETIGGKVYSSQTELPSREGYDFAGWYVSMTGNKAELAYELADNTEVKENITAYAQWTEKRATGKLTTPVVSVTDKLISWKPVNNVRDYSVKVTKPDGTTLVQENNVSGTSKEIDLTKEKAGDYRVEVIAQSSAGESEYSDACVRVYRNKALARVSLFGVTGNNQLKYNKVDNATKYEIKIDCGDKGHVHEALDNGTSDYYPFGNCQMQEGGIKFVVTASAEGYATSVSEEYVYELKLKAVENFVIDNEHKLTWDKVSEATSYEVKIGEERVTVYDNGISLKEYGKSKVEVIAKATGYNDSEASEYDYDKKELPTPKNVKLNGNKVTWEKVENATGYTVRVGSEEITVTTTEADITQLITDTTKDYNITVTANGTVDSIPSDIIDAKYKGIENSLEYGKGEVSWNAVIGATEYEVKVKSENAEQTYEVTDGSTKVKVTLLGTVNTIEVRYIQNGVTSNTSSITVDAYRVTFDTVDGEGQAEAQYYAKGDPIAFPDELTKTGYTHDGWYNSKVGAEGNAGRYTDEVYSLNGNSTLYANWKPNKYIVTLDYNGIGEGDVKEIEVTYGKPFTFGLPDKILDGMYVFSGWGFDAETYTVITDELGKSLDKWDVASDATIYAKYQSILVFDKQETDGTYWVTSIRANTNKIITIPGEYRGPEDDKYYKVTTISDTAFKNCPDVEIINLPADIEYVYNTAFQTLANLREINVEIDENNREPMLKSQDGVLFFLNERLSEYEIWAYPQAKGDEVYTIPLFVKNIYGNGAFYRSRFKEVIIPATVLSVSANSFRSDTLEKVTFLADSTYVKSTETDPDKPQPLTIAGGAFRYSKGIAEITLPARFDDNFNVDLFYNLDSLEVVKLDPDSILSLTADGMVCRNIDGENVLVFCPNARAGEITIPSGISVVGEHSFSGCKYITKVTIPNYVKRINKQAFAGYTIMVDGVSANMDVSSCSLLETVVIEGGGITGLIIGESAFGYNSNRVKTISHLNSVRCPKLTNLIFDDTNGVCNVTEIGDYAFSGAPFKTVKLPSMITKLGDYAFAYCDELVDFNFEKVNADDGDIDENRPALVVGTGVFSGCNKLESMFLPYYFDMTNSKGIFNGCPRLSKVDVDEKNPYLTSDNGVLFDKKVEKIFFYPAGRTGDYELPESVKLIGEGVFEGKVGLTGITIHNNIESIEAGAFNWCSELKFVTFIGDLNGTLTIGEKAFFGCLKLSKVVFPRGLTSIGKQAFYGCTQLEEINLPDGLTTIGSEAFRDCTSLVGDKSTNTLTFPKTIESIYNAAFQSCTSLKKVYFEDKIDGGKLNFLTSRGVWGGSNGTSDFVFYGCEQLQEVHFPEGLINISGSMFSSIATLTKVNIPSTVEYISSGVFSNCVNLTDLTFAPRPNKNKLEFYISSTVNTFANIGITRLELPEGVEQIGYNLFSGLKKLESVIIPSTVKNDISKYKNDYSITGSAIDTNAFSGCSNLVSFVCVGGGEGTFSIANGAFSSCGKLKTVVLPENFTAYQTSKKTYDVVGYNTFNGCVSLEKIQIRESAAVGDKKAGEDNEYHTDENGFILNKAKNEIVYCPYGKKGDITIPYYITSIACGAFYSNPGITSVTFADPTEAELKAEAEKAENGKAPNFDLVIGEKATSTSNSNMAIAAPFYYCTSLVTVNFPARLTTLGKYAFNNCQKLTDVNFDANCKLDKIDSNTFKQCYKLVSIDLPASVTTIGESAFENCPALVDFNISSNSKLTVIGKNAFKMSAVRAFNIPDSVTSLGDSAFEGCTQLTEISMPNTLKNANGVFYGCSNLNSITVRTVTDESGTAQDQYLYAFDDAIIYTTTKNSTGEITSKILVSVAMSYRPSNGVFEIPDDVTEIGANAMAFANGITKVVVPTSVKKIGNNAFYMSRISEVEFASDETGSASSLEIGYNVFLGNTELVRINFPKRLNKLGNNTFQYCSGLTEVTFDDGCLLTAIPTGFLQYTAVESFIIPSNVNNLGGSAFRYSNLKSISIPAKITTFGTYIFADSVNLQTVVFESGRNATVNLGNSMFSKCISLTSVVLPDRMLKTGTSTFDGCEKLSSVVIPSTATTIDSYAFRNCKKLASVVFDGESNCTDINSNAFNGCVALNTITLPNKLNKIASAAFANTGLTNITIPGSVTSLVSGIFTGSPLKTVVFADGNRTDFAIPSAMFYNITTLESVTLPNDLVALGRTVKTGSITYGAFQNTGLMKITIPASVKYVGEKLFQDCGRLSEVIFGEGCSVLAWNTGYSSTENTNSFMFTNCTALTNVILPEGIKGLGVNLFSGLSSLQNVTLPNSLTRISNYAFYNTGITDIVIPGNVTYIGFNTFRGCSALASITFEAGTDALTTNSNAFYNSGITSVTIPARMTVLGASAFADCHDLIEVKFEADSRLTTIGNNAFWGTSFITVNIPSSVKSIGNSAFRSSKLKNILFEQDSELEEIGSYVFAYSSLEEFVLPAQLAEIGGYAFVGCNNIANIDVSANSNFAYDLGILYNKDKTVLYYANPSVVTGDVQLYDAVAEIAPGAFKNCNITALDAHSNIGLTICSDSFDGCNSLVELILGDSTTVEEGAFSGCGNLQSVTMGDKAKVDHKAFADCSRLNSFEFGIGSEFGNNVFENCISLKSIVIPENTVFGNDVFVGCGEVDIRQSENLTMSYKGYDIEVGDDGIWFITITENIDDYKFQGDTMLRGVKIVGSGVIGEGAFKDCTALEFVEIGDSVTSIGLGAFNGCSSLKRMVTPLAGGRHPTDSNPNGITEFGYIFGSTSNTQNATNMPESLKTVVFTGNYNSRSSMFKNCQYIEYLELTNPVLHYLQSSTFSGCTNLKTLVIGGTPTELPSMALDNCPSLEEITIPASITSINATFASCTKLKRVNYLGTIDQLMRIYMGQYSSAPGAAYPLYNATLYIGGSPVNEIVLPNTLTTIGEDIYGNLKSGCGQFFKGATTINSLTIPSSVKTIAYDAFSGCSNLKRVYIDSIEQWLEYNFTAESYNPLSNGAYLYINKTLMENLVIPDGTETVSGYAFTKCASIKSVTIPAGIKKFGSSAFAACPNLTRVTVNDGATDLGNSGDGAWMFKDCTRLSSVSLPSSIKTFANFCFENTAIAVINLPEGVVSISGSMFKNCKKLTGITIPSTVSVINGSAFIDCVSLTSITFATDDNNDCAIKEFGASSFQNCVGLKNLVVPMKVVTIGKGSFDGWTSAQKISFRTNGPLYGWNTAWNNNCAADFVWGYTD